MRRRSCDSPLKQMQKNLSDEASGHAKSARAGLNDLVELRIRVSNSEQANSGLYASGPALRLDVRKDQVGYVAEAGNSNRVTGFVDVHIDERFKLEVVPNSATIRQNVTSSDADSELVNAVASDELFSSGIQTRDMGPCNTCAIEVTALLRVVVT